MCCDYRNTKYCPSMENLKQKKDSIVEDIKRAHPRAQNMHTYISRNDEPYKNNFIDAYNGKCAYCGVSIKIIPKRMFEIDHFIYERAEIFHGSKAAAGYIKNLVLSCQMCNRLKNYKYIY